METENAKRNKYRKDLGEQLLFLRAMRLTIRLNKS